VLKTQRYSLEDVYKGLYSRIAEGIERLNLVSYNREALVHERGKEEVEATQRNEALIAIIKTNFRKRFESSVEAFRISVGNQLAFQGAFLKALAEGRILDADSYRRILAFDPDADIGDVVYSLPLAPTEDYDEATFRTLVQEDVRTLESLSEVVEGVGVDDDEKLFER
jgi:hypothetical protein